MAILLLAAAAAGQESPVGARVRGADDGAKRLLALALEQSSTVRSLVAELEGSNLIVLVSYEPPAPWRSGRPFHGSTRLLCTAGGQRYVAIWIDSLWRTAAGSRYGIALLGHELQHAVEVARAPWVVDDPGMTDLFTKIGREQWARHFETQAALAVESRVSRELAAASAPAPASAAAFR